MNSTLKYRGYEGSVLYSAEDRLLYGCVLGIRDSISYEGASIAALEADFHAAIDDYLDDCAEDGVQPNVPFTAWQSFQVAPDLQRRASVFAAEHNLELSAVVERALSQFLEAAV